MNFFQILESLGLTTSLNICLDAGSSSSYSGTGQTWTDLSGGGNDYVLGATSGAEASDPIFVGTAGDLLETTYFESNTALDHFTEASAHTYADNWHKNNGAMTTILVGRNVDIINNRGIWSNGCNAAADAGFSLRLSAGKFNSRHSITTTTRETIPSAMSLVADTWTFEGQSFDEATLVWLFRFNSATETASPGPVASTDTDPHAVQGRIWISGGGTLGSVIGDKIMMFAQWSRALTDAEMAQIYTAVKDRVPSMP